MASTLTFDTDPDPDIDIDGYWLCLLVLYIHSNGLKMLWWTFEQGG